MKLKKVIAGVLSAAMLLSIGGTMAFAVDDGAVVGESTVVVPSAPPIAVSDEEITIYSVMNLSEDAISAPNKAYTYTIEASYRTTYYYNYIMENGETFNAQVPVEEGVMDGASFAPQTVTFSVNDYATAEHTVTKPLMFNFASVEYTAPGCYHYVITETEQVEEGAYAEPQTRDLYVQVTDTNLASVTTPNLVVTKVVMLNGGSKSNCFENAYGIASADGDAGFDSVDFVITDTAYGNMADRTKAFGFAPLSIESTVAQDTVFAIKKVDGTVGYIIQTATGLQYATKTEGASGQPEDATYAPTGTPFTFSLHSGQSVSIQAVAAGMGFNVSISDAKDEGYSYYARGHAGTEIVSTTPGSAIVSRPERAAVDFEAYFTSFGQGFVKGTDYDVRTITIMGTDVEMQFLTFISKNLADYLTQTHQAEFPNMIFDPGALEGGVGQAVQNFLDYVILFRGEYNEGHIFPWFDINATQNYWVQINQLPMVQVGDTSDDYKQIACDVGIDFATVKGQEKPGGELDDKEIVYQPALPDTGVVLDLTPYAVMVALAAGFITIRLARKPKA